MLTNAPVEQSDHVDYVLRAAACLGALGYSPHEVVGIVAVQLGVEHGFVAQVLRCRDTGPIVAAA